ncbi:ABC transporter ATP-binding protein [Pseudomonadota bacterium]
MTSPLICCEKLCKDYAMGDEVLHALQDVNLQICSGEFVAIMGPSGSGKSTLMNLLGALDSPSSGNLFIDEHNLAKLSPDQLAQLRNKTIGFVFQQFNLLSRTTALENVILPLLYSRANTTDITTRAYQCLQRVGLSDRLEHQSTQLSGGQQQRVAIARALVNNPAVILADEPTGALDTQTSIDILNLFQELNQSGITVIIVTHDPEVAEVSKRKLLFRDGRLIDDVR